MHNNSINESSKQGVTASPMRAQRDLSTGAGHNMINVNRKKIRELLYGGSASRIMASNQTGSYIEKEQLQNDKRILKLQFNQLKEDFTKLKTKY